MKVGFLHSIIRPEEKLLLAAFKRRGVDVHLLDDRSLELNPSEPDLGDVDGVLARSVSSSRNLYARWYLESLGIRCFNRASVASLCQDKMRTSLALDRASVPQPDYRAAFTEESALAAIESMGYPVVLKPVVGSWGRLIAKASDRDSAESLLEHKAALPNYQHHIYYIQRYVDKGGFDIRSFVIGDRCVAAIRRTSKAWRTNTARGATTENQPVNEALAAASLAAAKAVGGGMLAVDLFEVDGEYLVNEVNDTMEFRNSVAPTGVDIPQEMVDYVIEQMRSQEAAA